VTDKKKDSPFWKLKWDPENPPHVRILDESPLFVSKDYAISDYTVTNTMAPKSWGDVPICQTWEEFHGFNPSLLGVEECQNAYRHYFDLWIWTCDEHKMDYHRMAEFFEWAVAEAKRCNELFNKALVQIRIHEKNQMKYGHMFFTQSQIDKLTKLAQGVNTGTDPGDTPD
jgi:hypothetical protein